MLFTLELFSARNNMRYNAQNDRSSVTILPLRKARGVTIVLQSRKGMSIYCGGVEHLNFSSRATVALFFG